MGLNISESCKYVDQNLNPKVLVIVSCTKKKLSITSPANELYQGDIFKNSKNLAINHNFDLLIISAKHGLVKPYDILKPYDLRLKNLSEARLLQKKVNPNLKKYLWNYDLVILILGNIYLEVINPLFSHFPQLPFYRLISKNGIFDYKKNIRKLLQGNIEVLYKISGPDYPINQIIYLS